MAEDLPGGENLDPQKLRLDFGVLETGGFNENAEDEGDAKEAVVVLRGAELDDEEGRLNETEIEKEEKRKKFLENRERVSHHMSALLKFDKKEKGLGEESHRILKDLGFEVEIGYFRGEDLGDPFDKGVRRSEIESTSKNLKVGKADEKMNEVLEKMGIDTGKYKDIIDSWIETDSQEPKMLLEYISKHDLELNRLLLQSWDESLLAVEGTRKLILEMYERSGEREEVVEATRQNIGDPKVCERLFALAQKKYLNDLCNPGRLSESGERSRVLKTERGGVNTENFRDFNDFNLKVENHNSRLETMVAESFVNERRKPPRNVDATQGDGQEMYQNLRNFIFRELGVETLQRDNSELGRLQRALQEYSPSKEPDVWVKERAQLEVLDDNERKYLKDFATLRRFTYFVDTREELDKATDKEVDKAILGMINIKNEAGEPEYPVADAFLIYRRILNEEISLGNYPVDIDSEKVKNLFKSYFLGVSRGNMKYVEFAMSLGRDLIRLTGIDSPCGLYTDGEGKLKNMDVNTGGLLRGVINTKVILMDNPKNVLLANGIRVGAVPFWDSLGSTTTDFVDVDSFVSFVNSNLSENSKKMSDWVGGIIEKVKPALDAEKDFITKPQEKTLKGFIEKVVPAYQKARIKDDEILVRLENVIRVLVAERGANIPLINKELESFIGKGIINDMDTLNEFRSRVGLPANSLTQIGSQVSNVGSKLSGAQGRVERFKTGLGVLDELGKFLSGMFPK